ncbi:MAG: shikimate dehydrogenase [Schwartzia sp.]|nr:shikimate dehydrogenase [Schwartzia sp. (in: firmicutes)]
MVSGKTINLGVIGWPIAHSLSPAMQTAAIRAAGVDYSYIAMPVRPDAIQGAVEGLRSLGFRGFNVTIPHKTAVIGLLDEIDEDARRIGAVNTVVNEGGRLLGRNTDVAGFLLGLSRQGIEVRGRRAVVLGAGGAARAVLWGLLREGASGVTVAVRNAAKAKEALADFSKDVEIISWDDDAFAGALQSADILVNTTPLGMTPNLDAAPPVDWAHVRPEAFVYDIIYTPARTRFLREAETHGHRVQSGAVMLVGQGAEAFRLWTGVRPDEKAMETALLDALRASAGEE